MGAIDAAVGGADRDGDADKSRRVLVLVGPTASGKTDVSLSVALTLGGEIISADSRQIYRFLNIGTAKPAKEQQSAVPHHFVDEISPDREFSAGEFGETGRRVIDEVFRRGHLPIVVGGSGLYIQSLIDGFFEGPGADADFRQVLEQRLRKGELAAMVEELRRVDPVSAARIDPTKPRRIVRALEVYHVSGKPLSAHHAGPGITIDFTPVMFGLLWDRKELYKRIDRRCEQMVEGGLLDEAEALEIRGYPAALNSLNTVGYREAFALRRGEIGMPEMLRLFKQNSRRYAKRQLTWFRRDPRIHWIPMTAQRSFDDAAEEICMRFRSPTSP